MDDDRTNESPGSRDLVDDDAARDALLTRRLNALAHDTVPVDTFLEGLERRAERILRRRRITLGAVLGVIIVCSILVSASMQRSDRHVVTANPTSAPPSHSTTTAPPVPSTLPTGVSLEQLPASTPHAGIQNWDATLPNGDMRFSCIYQFGQVQYSVTSGVVHTEASAAALPGWYLTQGDNDNTFSDGTNIVVVSGAATPDATGSRCRISITAQGLPPTTTLPPPGPVSLATLPSGTNGAIPDKDLGGGNVTFTCNYTFGWAYFGANDTSIAFLNAFPSLPGWSVTAVPWSDSDPIRQVRFTNGAETVLVTASEQPEASGSRCHAERQGGQ